MLRPHDSYRRREVVHHTYTVLTPAQVVSQYPHGRYELRLQGRQYVWVWSSTVPPAPAPPPAPAVLAVP